MKNLLLSTIIYLLTNSVFSKETGTITFTTRNSFSGAAIISNIKIANSTFSNELSTDKNGSVLIELPTGIYNFEISSDKFQSQKSNYTIEVNKSLNINVSLDPQIPYELESSKDEFIISGFVVDKITSQPISDVALLLNNNKVNFKTNVDGYFKFKMPYKEKSLNKKNNYQYISLGLKKEGYKLINYNNILMCNGTVLLKIELEKGFGNVNIIQTQKLINNVNIDNLNDDKENDKIQNSINKMSNSNSEISIASCSPQSTIRLYHGNNSGPCVSCSGCTTIEQMSLEYYVRTGLDDEWIASWNDASLLAGAVAYRTYGAYHILHPYLGSSNYDIVAYPCRQHWNGSTSYNSTINATNSTVNEVLVNSSGNIVFSEYAAETNNFGCGNGYSGQTTGTTWPCIQDNLCTGYSPSGHGRGMCQWGSHRWAQAGNSYTWILDHYYNPGNYYRCSSSSCIDNYESNNSSGTATDVFANPLNSTNSSNYSIQGNIGYAGDQDWFKIKIAACGTLTLNLSSLPQNYDLELYGANGLSQFIRGSYNSSTQNEQIIYNSTSSTSTYVFAKVYPNNSNDFTTASCYNLQFLWSPTTCASSCTGPSNVIVSNTTQTSVLVSWTAPIGTSSTYLRYRALSSGSFTQVDVTGLTSYTIPNLSCATNYEEYLISNCNSGGTQSTSTQSFSTSSCTPICTAPSNVNISNTTQTSVLVSWTAPVGTSSTYLRYRALSSGSFTQVDVTGLTSYTISGLSCGTNYEEYLISNCNSGGTQSTSTLSFSTSTCTPTCIAPSNLQVTTIQTTATFTWLTGTGATSQEFWYRKTSDINYTKITALSTTLNTKTLEGLLCNTEYTALVVTNCNGNLQYSSNATFTTSACPVTCISPSNFQVTASQTSASFTWTNGNTNSFRRIWYKKTTDPTFTQTSIISSSATSYQLTGLSCNTNYQCFLYDSCSNGTIYTIPQPDLLFTTSACTTCTSPTSFQVTANQTSASFTWTNGNINSYRRIWYKKTADPTFTQTPIITSTATSYQITGLTCNTNYQCFLYDSCGNGIIYTIPQPDLFFTTSACPVPCTVPTNLQSNPSQTSATVSWANGSGTNYYKIRYKKTTDLNFIESALLSANATSYQITGLTCNTPYDWYIYDSCSNGSISVIPSSIPATFTTTTCCTTPSAPNSLTTGYPSSNTIGLSWAGSIVGFTNFDIERATSASGPFVHLTYVAPPTTNYNDNSIVAGTTYYYRVRACCDINCSAYSNTSSATACVWRNRATSITISNDTICQGNSVTLTVIGGNLGTGDVWTWYLNGGFPIGTGSPITFTPTTSGTYCVKPDGGCVNQPNVSVTCKDFTVITCSTPCNPLGNSSTSNTTSNSTTVNWNLDNSVNLSNLTIEYKPTTNTSWSSNVLLNNATTTNLNNLNCSKNYQYRIIATCVNGLKDTTSGTFTTLVCPTNFCDTLPRINQIPSTCDLYTANVTGATSYQWFRNGVIVGTNSRFYTVSGGNAIYNVTISNGSQTCTSLDYTFGCNITAVQNNIITDNYSIFPNPTTSSVFIQSKTNSNLKISISLTNVIGQEVQQKIITTTNQYELSLKNLPVGVYILNISDDKGSGSMKIIKE